MSLALRHHPSALGLSLDKAGWAEVDQLLKGLGKRGLKIDLKTLQELVETNDKQRFALSDDHKYIRANQGHSIDVELELDAVEPPYTLYHGTVQKFMATIKNEGLKKMNRMHVHLSKDVETAQKVGSRRGVPIILKVDALQMHKAGFTFYLAENGVWLTDHVPPQYIRNGNT